METKDILAGLHAAVDANLAAAKQLQEQLTTVAMGLSQVPVLMQQVVGSAQAIQNAQEATKLGLDQLAASLPRPTAKGWGKGPRSGLPWYSGARHQNLKQVQAFLEAGGRKSKPCDILQCFTGPEQAENWTEIAGGPTDDPHDWQGLVSLREGQAAADMIWRDVPDLPAVMTLRPIPESDSNRGGRNPGVWRRIAAGERDQVYTRLGRKFAGLDEVHARAGQVILEIAHEMTGDWYAHAIKGAHGDFPAAWVKIVAGIRTGYRQVANKDCPYLFWLRPSRETVEDGVWTESLLPPLDFWDGIGLSQHDNKAMPCTLEKPRINWTRQKKQWEGLENIAEIAAANGKLLGFSEWSSHNPSSDRSGPNAGIFTQSMWDFYSRQDVQAVLAYETYFLSSISTIAGFPEWEGAKAYKRLWGGAA